MAERMINMLTLDDKLRSWKGLSIAVLGLGVSNRPLVRLLLEAGCSVTGCDRTPREKLDREVLDLEAAGCKLRCGDTYLEGVEADILFRTPGMHPGNPTIQTLVKKGAKKYVIDDAELERVYREYPIIWKDKDADPKLCFMGCPHFSLQQLKDWTDRVEAGLKKNGAAKVTVPTVFTAAPDVVEAFNKTEYADRLKATGVIVSSICPLMYMNNPLCGKMPVITCSNKLRTYTTARFYSEDEIVDQITKKKGGK